MDFLEQEVQNGALAACKKALDGKWKPALLVDSAEYMEETTETEQDRTESAYFA